MIWLPLTALGVVLAVAAATGSTSSPSRPPIMVDGDREAVAEEIADLAGRLDWPALPDLLVNVAYTESRFNPSLVHGNRANSPVGAFGGVPSSVLVGPLEDLDPSALKDLRLALVAHADYIARLRRWSGGKPAHDLTGLDVRRGMAYPSLVSDYGQAQPRSREVAQRLAQAERATGLPVATRKIFPPGWTWIGIPEALRRLDWSAS